MTYKLAISKSGYNVLTETNPNNFVFSSEYNTLKYLTTGTASITFSTADKFGDGYGKIISITHNAGYYPYVEVYVQDWDGNFVIPMRRTGASFFYQHFVYVTTTNLYFGIKVSSAFSGTLTAYYNYFIFKNNLGL